jgi:porphobilinogen deaminase
MTLSAWVGLPDGSAWASDELAGALAQPEALGREVAARLSLAGAAELLAQAEQMVGAT